MLTKLSDSVWKISFDSNLYVLKLDETIVIDTGLREYKDKIQKEIAGIADIDKIRKVIFTHFHYDHTGNFDIFRNAEFYASEQEIRDLNNDQSGAVLDNNLARIFKASTQLKPITQKNKNTINKNIEIIFTPGHTSGSISVWYEKEKLLFSGDTMFKNSVGRTDLETSVPEKIEESLKTLADYKYKKLCAGHDY